MDKTKTTLIHRHEGESITDYTLRCLQTWGGMQVGNTPDIEELLKDNPTDRRKENR